MSRLIRLVIEYSLSLLPYENVVVDTPQVVQYRVAEIHCFAHILRQLLWIGGGKCKFWPVWQNQRFFCKIFGDLKNAQYGMLIAQGK
jgi:hypothetical protein